MWDFTMRLNSLESFFNNNYMPHGHCYLWQPSILWTNVIADLVIAIAYFSIPFAIMLFAKKRPDIKYHQVALLFSAFILLCGITHAFSIVTIWQGAYGWHGLLKTLTAIVSAATAIYLYKLLPELIKIPSPAQYDGMQKALSTASKSQRLLSMKVDQLEMVQFMLDAMPMSGCLLDNKLNIVNTNKKFSADIAQVNGNIDLVSLLVNHNSANQTFISELKKLASESTQTQHKKLKEIIYIKSQNKGILPVEVLVERRQLYKECFFVMTLTNLSELQKVKQELDESEQRFDRALQASQDGIWEINFVTKTIIATQKFAELIGLQDPTQVKISHWRDHILPSFRNYVFDGIKSDWRHGEHFSVEYQGIDADGNYAWFKLVGKAKFDKFGQILTVSGALRNIQSNKALEYKVHEKNELLNTIYEGANHAIWVLNVESNFDFRFLVFNPTAAASVNATPEQIEGKLLDEIDHSIFSAEMINAFRINYQSCVAKGAPFTYIESVGQSGTSVQRWFQTTLYPIKDVNDEVKKIVGTAIDITPLKQTEALLSEQQELLENIIDASVCAVYLYSIQSKKIVRINHRFTDILGYSKEKIDELGSLNDLFHNDDKPIMMSHLESTLSSTPGELHKVKMRVRHLNQSWVHCDAVSTVLKNDRDDQPQLMLTTFIDVTEQVTLLSELEASNSSLQRFAVAASHDLQEPLRKISAFSGILKERLAPALEKDEDSQYQFSRIIDASNRMSAMISDIFRLSKISRTTLILTQFPLEDAIKTAIDSVQLFIEENDAQITTSGADLFIRADQSLITLLLQNLITNAIKFRSDRVPVIEIAAQSTSYCTIVTVKDNGVGIDPDYTEQIFEAFRRLDGHVNQKNKGSGIGLAICKQICTAHGGSIHCTSKVNEGTEFKIKLPK